MTDTQDRDLLGLGLAGDVQSLRLTGKLGCDWQARRSAIATSWRAGLRRA